MAAGSWERSYRALGSDIDQKNRIPPTAMASLCASLPIRVTQLQPDLAEIVSLASEFGVSKEAMARGSINAHR